MEQGNVWDIFTNPQRAHKGLLACRPPLDKRYKFLPTMSDFMRIDEKGEIIQNDITVEEFTNDLVVPVSERKKKHNDLYAQEPLLQIKNENTFPN